MQQNGRTPAAAATPFSSILKHRLKGEGGAAEWQNSRRRRVGPQRLVREARAVAVHDQHQREGLAPRLAVGESSVISLTPPKPCVSVLKPMIQIQEGGERRRITVSPTAAIRAGAGSSSGSSARSRCQASSASAPAAAPRHTPATRSAVRSRAACSRQAAALSDPPRRGHGAELVLLSMPGGAAASGACCGVVHQAWCREPSFELGWEARGRHDRRPVGRLGRRRRRRLVHSHDVQHCAPPKA